jgi:hypothetical protein
VNGCMKMQPFFLARVLGAFVCKHDDLNALNVGQSMRRFLIVVPHLRRSIHVSIVPVTATQQAHSLTSIAQCGVS